MDSRTNIGRVRGLGSAKDGTHHWWAQRVTAVALIPLVLWLVVSVLRLVGAPHQVGKVTRAAHEGRTQVHRHRRIVAERCAEISAASTLKTMLEVRVTSGSCPARKRISSDSEVRGLISRGVVWDTPLLGPPCVQPVVAHIAPNRPSIRAKEAFLKQHLNNDFTRPA